MASSQVDMKELWAGIGWCVIFGGGVLAWAATQLRASAAWLLDHNILTRDDLVVTVIDGMGFDMPRVVVGVIVLVVSLVVVSWVVRMVTRTYVERKLIALAKKEARDRERNLRRAARHGRKIM